MQFTAAFLVIFCASFCGAALAEGDLEMKDLSTSESPENVLGPAETAEILILKTESASEKDVEHWRSFSLELFDDRENAVVVTDFIQAADSDMVLSWKAKTVLVVGDVMADQSDILRQIAAKDNGLMILSSIEWDSDDFSFLSNSRTCRQPVDKAIDLKVVKCFVKTLSDEKKVEIFSQSLVLGSRVSKRPTPLQRNLFIAIDENVGEILSNEVAANIVEGKDKFIMLNKISTSMKENARNIERIRVNSRVIDVLARPVAAAKSQHLRKSLEKIIEEAFGAAYKCNLAPSDCIWEMSRLKDVSKRLSTQATDSQNHVQELKIPLRHSKIYRDYASRK